MIAATVLHRSHDRFLENAISTSDFVRVIYSYASRPLTISDCHPYMVPTCTSVPLQQLTSKVGGLRTRKCAASARGRCWHLLRKEILVRRDGLRGVVVAQDKVAEGEHLNSDHDQSIAPAKTVRGVNVNMRVLC